MMAIMIREPNFQFIPIIRFIPAPEPVNIAHGKKTDRIKKVAQPTTIDAVFP